MLSRVLHIQSMCALSVYVGGKELYKPTPFTDWVSVLVCAEQLHMFKCQKREKPGAVCDMDDL